MKSAIQVAWLDFKSAARTTWFQSLGVAVPGVVALAGAAIRWAPPTGPTDLPMDNLGVLLPLWCQVALCVSFLFAANHVRVRSALSGEYRTPGAWFAGTLLGSGMAGLMMAMSLAGAALFASSRIPLVEIGKVMPQYGMLFVALYILGFLQAGATVASVRGLAQKKLSLDAFLWLASLLAGSAILCEVIVVERMPMMTKAVGLVPFWTPYVWGIHGLLNWPTWLPVAGVVSSASWTALVVLASWLVVRGEQGQDEARDQEEAVERRLGKAQRASTRVDRSRRAREADQNSMLDGTL